MVLRTFLPIALLLVPLVASGNSPVPASPPQVLQDSKTKIIYYLESDRRHVAAIASDGKLLWCCEVIRTPQNDFQRAFHIDHIGWDGDDISVVVWAGAGGVGKINKSTGAYSPPTVTQ